MSALSVLEKRKVVWVVIRFAVVWWCGVIAIDAIYATERAMSLNHGTLSKQPPFFAFSFLENYSYPIAP
jgi:hypothetical protein